MHFSGTAAIILFANEEIAVAVSDAPSFVDTIIEDSQSFIDNTETQMSFVVNSSASIGINAVNKDLDGNFCAHLFILNLLNLWQIFRYRRLARQTVSERAGFRNRCGRCLNRSGRIAKW